MVNAFQKNREVNINHAKTLIAQTMPEGISDKKLVAVLKLKCAEVTVRDYLSSLEDAGIIEYDREKDVWRMVG